MTINPYPLLWPERHVRTAKERRRFSSFKVSLDQAAKEARNHLKNFGAKEVVITSNIRAELGGAGELVGQDPGVAVWFQWRGKQQCFACDTYIDVRSNVRAIGNSIEAVAMLERHNAQLLDQFMSATNVDALPSTAGVTSEWFAGCAKSDDIEKKYRELVKKWHPDVAGGDASKMAEINAAKDRAMKEIAA